MYSETENSKRYHEVLAWISVDYSDSTEKPSITLSLCHQMGK